MPSEAATPHGVTKTGDLVHLEYDLWAEGGGRTDLIDTTHEEVAQKANASTPEGTKWGPRPHVIGGEYFPGAIEAALTGVAVGEEIVREFAPADAFGERDANLIELFSMHEISRLPEMRKDDAHLDLGTVLTIEGRRGRVVTLTAARVRVDFNPPYAGRKIKGTFKVIDRITEPAEQVRGILELQYGRGAEFHIESHEKTITIKVPDRSKFDISWMATKPRVIDRIRTTLHPHTIRLVEEYVTPTPAKAEADAKEKDAPKGKETEAKEPALAEADAAPAAEASPPKHHRKSSKADAATE
jgi:FKBP-type peptidyl-prolyl cis-trans isomerase 2